MTAADFDARIRRARTLAARYRFSSEVLAFYLHLASFQNEIQRKIETTGVPRPPAGKFVSLRDQIELDLVLPELEKLLNVIKLHAPKPLSEFLKSLGTNGNGEWANLLDEYREKGGTPEYGSDPRKELVARTLLQPLAELRAGELTAPPMTMALTTCPLCGSLPVAGVLRPEGDGGKRLLLCSYCGHEWEFRRILCANCGETREEQLPVFVAEQFPQLRVECCSTCRKFLRTADLTKDGNAVPNVDDLAAIPLTLWASEHGYERIYPNLLGT